MNEEKKYRQEAQVLLSNYSNGLPNLAIVALLIEIRDLLKKKPEAKENRTSCPGDIWE